MEELIRLAKKCKGGKDEEPCKVCRILLGSSRFNREVCNPPDEWDTAALAKKANQRKTGKM